MPCLPIVSLQLESDARKCAEVTATIKRLKGTSAALAGDAGEAGETGAADETGGVKGEGEAKVEEAQAQAQGEDDDEELVEV